MKLRLWLALVGLSASISGSAYAWDYSVSVSGNTIIVNVSGMDNTTSRQTCAGASVDVQGGGASCGQPGLSFATIPLGCNAVGTHAVFVQVFDSSTGGQYEFRQTVVTVSDPPSPTCPQFELRARGTKVLTHKYGDSIGSAASYPTGQTTDAEIDIALRPLAAPAGTVIYLKVIDPEDTAAYGPHQPDDNVDQSRGTIDGAKTTSVTLPPTGTVDRILKTTLNAAGDNYKVQASADPNLSSDPNFVCSPSNGCQTTPVITAWKRMYIEMDEMYRKSQLLADRVLIGESVVYVNVRPHRGDDVRLIHAPSYLRIEPQDVDGFYSEDRKVVAVAANRDPNQPGAFAVTLDAPLMLPYYTDLTVGSVKLGDALVELGSDPLFHFDEQYVVGAFAEAFVEVVKSPTSGVALPFYSAMNDQAMLFVGAKWFAARQATLVPSNFGLAVAAATRASLATANQFSLGTTGGPYSYVWRDNINTATSGPRSKFPLTSGLNATIVSGEVLVHELAHQWNVNSGYTDHECTKNGYANALKFCQGNGPQNSGQYGDGIIKFHYEGTTPATADSEYMTMRKAGEPKP